MFLRVEDVQGRNCLTNFWVRGVPPEPSAAPASQQGRRGRSVKNTWSFASRGDCGACNIGGRLTGKGRLRCAAWRLPRGAAWRLPRSALTRCAAR